MDKTIESLSSAMNQQQNSDEFNFNKYLKTEKKRSDLSNDEVGNQDQLNVIHLGGNES